MLHRLLKLPSVFLLAAVSGLVFLYSASSGNWFEEEASADLVVYLAHFECLERCFVPLGYLRYLLNP